MLPKNGGLGGGPFFILIGIDRAGVPEYSSNGRFSNPIVGFAARGFFI